MTPTPLITLRPSDTHWLYGCTAAPGYIVANAHRIPEQSTEYSIEGGMAHKCAEAFVLGKKAPKGTPAEIKKHARAYADFVEQYKWVVPPAGSFVAANTDGKSQVQWGVEESVDRFYQPGRPAIVDFYAITSRKVTIIDLKYGQGVAVSAVNNKQLAIYARGVIEKHFLPGMAPDELEVEMHIWQPRIREGEKHTVWRTTWGELRQWTDDEIKSLADIILSQPVDIPAMAEGRTYMEGIKGVQFLVDDNKTCRFCAVKKFCPAREAVRLDELPVLADLLDGNPPEDTDDIELARIMQHGPKAIKWIEDRMEHANILALSGHPIPDHKLVQGRGGHRVWKDEKLAAKVLRTRFSPKVLYTRKIATPSQIDEAMAAEHLPEDFVNEVKALMHKPEGKPTLVHISDKRPEWRHASLDELPDIVETKPETDWI